MDKTMGLQQEHDLILRGTIALERCAGRLGAPGGAEPAELARLATLLDFFREFVDGRHHAKEEGVLVPGLLAAGIAPDSEDLARIAAEHTRSRELLARATAHDKAAMLAAIPVYTEFLREHALLEERVLFPLVDRALDAAAKARVQEEFDRIDVRHGGAEAVARYESRIEALMAPTSVLDPKPKHPW